MRHAILIVLDLKPEVCVCGRTSLSDHIHRYLLIEVSILIYVYTSFLPPSFVRYLLIECEQQTADQCTAWGAGRAEADGDADGEGGGGMGR